MAGLTAAKCFSTVGKRDDQAGLGRLQPYIQSCSCFRADHRLEVADGGAGYNQFGNAYFDSCHQYRFGFAKLVASGGHQPGDDARG